MPITAQVIPSQLPEGTCYQSEQARLNGTAANLQVTFPITAGVINYGSTTPSADQREFPWYRLNPDGTPDKLYSFSNGLWIAPNPVPASDPRPQPYIGSLISIDTYDGGSAGAVGPASGPMWERYTLANGRFPFGVDGTTSTVPEQTGGATTHTLSINEMTPHTHVIQMGYLDFVSGSIGQPANAQTGANFSQAVTQSAGLGQPFSILNPYFSVFWIRRTARIFYAI